MLAGGQCVCLSRCFDWRQSIKLPTSGQVVGCYGVEGIGQSIRSILQLAQRKCEECEEKLKEVALTEVRGNCTPGWRTLPPLSAPFVPTLDMGLIQLWTSYKGAHFGFSCPLPSSLLTSVSKRTE